MPTRTTTAGIVAFWILTMAWLFHREIWPRLSVDEAPPFAVTLIEEAHDASRRYGDRWQVFHPKHHRVGTVLTKVIFQPDEDLYELTGRFELFSLPKPGAPPTPPPSFSLRGPYSTEQQPVLIKSSYFVTGEGRLRRIHVEVITQPKQDTVLSTLPSPIETSVTGTIADQHLSAYWWCQVSDKADERIDQNLDPVPVSTYGGVVNPFQPVPRLPGLHSGKTWRIPMINPLALAYKNRRPEIQILDAVVSEGELELRGNKIPCFIINYIGDNARIIRTWVRQSDNMVLRQEVNLAGQVLEISRYWDQ